MHVFSSVNYQDFQSTLQLIRFDYPYGKEKRESTLLVQANTLLLKYIIKKCKIELIFTEIHNRLLYILRIWDDNEHPVSLWSILERDDEYNALMMLVKGGVCHIFLFNELSITTAWKAIEFKESYDLFQLVNKCSKGPVKQDDFKKEVSIILNGIYAGRKDNCLIFEIDNTEDWNYDNAIYITNQIQTSGLDISKDIEGNYQEQVALWLIDNIHPEGAFHSPQILHGNGRREFTDLLFSYDNGCFLFESKALSILSRDSLPTRAELVDDATKHIEKALKQLKGCMRQLRNGTKVFSLHGEEIKLERAKPAHCIIIVSDLSLIPNDSLIDLNVIKKFMGTTQSYIHLVDPSELKRIIQAANIISSSSRNISLIQAFDYYLLERAKISIQKETLNIEVLLKQSK